MNEYAIQLKNIVKCYKDGEQDHTVLNNVSLNVEPGEFVAIVGPSGSGKSTLLSIMGVLLSPDQGTIQIGDTCVSEKKQKEWTDIRREQIGFIFQNHQLLPFLTVEEQLKLVQNMSKNKEEISVKQLLESLGLDELANKYPSKMSGGQKQRVAIARAFMNDPQVILADEPTASLDGERGRQVVEMIRHETKKRNKAAIMVTHDERVLELVDTIYRLENGSLVREK
ncbi:MAG: ABC transporter ATP-binding protein [bacterium]|nr:ABC transporter ATP-binding protein [bacterium]